MWTWRSFIVSTETAASSVNVLCRTLPLPVTLPLVRPSTWKWQSPMSMLADFRSTEPPLEWNPSPALI